MIQRAIATVAALALAGCCGAQVRPATTPARAPSIDEEVAGLFVHPFPEGSVPSGFEFSPDGRRLAYQLTVAAGPELWVVETAAPASARRLGPEGASPASAFEWLPDGSALLVSAGGDLWLQPVEAGAAPRRLTETDEDEEGARLSPDGAAVAFVRGWDLWLLDLETGAERPLTAGGSEALRRGGVDWVYEEELDLTSGFAWSPDGRRIAFLELDESAVLSYPVSSPGEPMPRIEAQRFPLPGTPNPGVRVGVVELPPGPLDAAALPPEPAWLDVQPGDGYVARLGWSPAGDRLFVLTLDRLQRNLQVLLVDPSCPERRLLVEERDERWLNLLDEPRFLGSADRFLWRSERDGHAHLYLYDGEAAPRQLTSGAWQVTEVVGVDEERSLVYFVGNREAPSSYHLYSVALAGGEPVRLTSAAGCHTVTMSPRHDRFVSVHSSLERQPRAELFLASGEPAFVLAEDALASRPDDGTVAELLEVPGPDGLRFDARLIRPRELEQGRRYPVLVWVYNGPGAQIVRDEWRTKYMPWMRLLARRGIVVFSMDGRGTTGRGRAWEKALYGRLGEVELEDQMLGVDHLRSLPFVDPSRIGVFGWSYGGTMVLHMLLRRPGTFRAGVSVAPVTDWRLYDSIYTERYMMRPEDNPDGYSSSSLLPHAAALEDPLLLVHGLSDDNVHLDNSTRMIDSLVAAGRRFDVMVYPGQSHGISAPASRRHVFSTVTSYLAEHLLR